MNADKAELDRISEAIIGAAFAVSNELGTGFLEKVYENALALELRERGFQVEQQIPIIVHYKGQNIGEYFADLLVNNEIIIELKASKNIDPAHLAQCMNYLRATGHRLGLILNFGKPRVEIKRVACDL